MFNECNTLAELNAARIKATEESSDLILINNEYNRRRQEILTTRKPFVQLNKIVVKPKEVQQYCGIPISGRSKQTACIELTSKGFLY